jgi:DNA-nicking Smr family endonuclease
VKKKVFVSSKDKQDWLEFTKNLSNLPNKDLDFPNYSKKKKLVKKIDLHGSSLSEANKIVKNFINDSYELGYSKLIVITGKGSRSKVYDDPYKSEKMSVLKYSVPEYINKNSSLSNKIISITEADRKDGGEGAFYIFLRKNKNL